MKRSTGACDEFFVFGNAAAVKGLKDQCARSSSVTFISARARFALVAESGHCAPASIQRLSKSICAEGKRSPLGGIHSSSLREVTSFMMRLSEACFGTMGDSPDSPFL